GEVLFAKSKATLTEKGKQQLNLVMRALHQLITSKTAQISLLSGIMIEGHTSQTGTERSNWQLSARRALAALQYLLSIAPPAHHKTYARLFAAAAHGQYKPVRTAGRIDNARSRRIEIKILFRQQQRIQQLLRQINRNPTP
ncbi:MAG: OmpA family protein, partial [Myxococcota bacterium]